MNKKYKSFWIHKLQEGGEAGFAGLTATMITFALPTFFI